MLDPLSQINSVDTSSRTRLVCFLKRCYQFVELLSCQLDWHLANALRHASRHLLI